jgi:uncharacterized membrane protein YgcG
MSDIAFTRSIRDQLSKAPPILVIAVVTLVGLTYYGVLLNLASAPHLQALDRTAFLQAEQIKRLTADLADLKRQVKSALHRLCQPSAHFRQIAIAYSFNKQFA